MTEAKEKQHTDFESGWEVSYDEVFTSRLLGRHGNYNIQMAQGIKT